MTDINDIQSKIREAIQNGEIQDGIEILIGFIKQIDNHDDQYLDSLIIISQEYRGLKNDDLSHTIDKETYHIQKNRIAKSLLKINSELPFIKKTKLNTIEKSESRAIVSLSTDNTEHANKIIAELLELDRTIVDLNQEVEIKNNEIQSIKDQSKIKLLKQEIDFLKEKIAIKETQYKVLELRYSELKKERTNVSILYNEITNYKVAIARKDEQISVLENQFVGRTTLHHKKSEENESLLSKIQKYRIWITVLIFTLVISLVFNVARWVGL